MENNVSFVELLKEITDLIRDYRPYHRGVCSKEISQILKRELVASLPKVFVDFDLQDAELFFMTTLMVEQDSCRDIIKYFSRFWGGSYEAALKTQMALELSIHQGALHKFIDEDSRDRLRLKPEIAAKVLLALVDAPEAAVQNVNQGSS